MGKDDKTVFISYRRKPSSAHGELIRRGLRGAGYDVFMDTSDLGPGKFEGEILRQVGARKHFLVIVEKGTLDRCVDENDAVRLSWHLNANKSIRRRDMVVLYYRVRAIPTQNKELLQKESFESRILHIKV